MYFTIIILSYLITPSSLLFATTNHIDRLDEALRRPGRMDVWINFKYATKWQAEGIFKCFFPSIEDTAAAAAQSQKTEEEMGETSGPKHKTYASIPLLHAKELEVLAKQFAEAIPENELSVSNDSLPTYSYILIFFLRLLAFKATS